MYICCLFAYELRGHVLLVGVGGCGKQSITRLAAFAAECNIFGITLARGYNENSFKEDLKTLYNLLGVGNKKTVFVFTAAQVYCCCYYNIYYYK